MPAWTLAVWMVLAPMLEFDFSGAAWKQVISWTLFDPPVPAEKPNRKLAGIGPFESVINWFVITGWYAPSL